MRTLKNNKGKNRAFPATAATKIQALVRGNRDRKKVNEYVTKLIEEMLLVDSTTSSSNVKGAGTNNNTNERKSSEDFVVLIEGGGDDDDDEETETIVEITIIDRDDDNDDNNNDASKAKVAASNIGKNTTPAAPAPVGARKRNEFPPPTTKTRTSSAFASNVTNNQKTSSSFPYNNDNNKLPEPVLQHKKIPEPVLPESEISAKEQQQEKPKKHRSALVNRYLNAASKATEVDTDKKNIVPVHKLGSDRIKKIKNQEDEDEIRKREEIERDFRLAPAAAARFKAGRAVQGEQQQQQQQFKNNNKERRKEDKTEAAKEDDKKGIRENRKENAIVKLQALARGMIARRKVADYVTSLIAEMMSFDEDGDDANTAQKDTVGKDDGLVPSVRFPVDDPVSETYEFVKDDNYYTDRLPSWWMEYVPHKIFDDTWVESGTVDIVYRPVKTKKD